jgi:glycosyltransferase involved in cell wall biosynthesis
MKLSVITVVRNASRVVEDTVRSVLEQTYSPIEYIVIDGASTDGTQAILARYRGKYSVYRSEPDAGIYDAMNKGLSGVTGDVVHFLNAGDTYCDGNTIAEIVPELTTHALCYGDLIYLDRRGGRRNLGVPYSWAEELKASRVPQPTLFVPAAFYREVGGFDMRYRIAADYEMFLRLARRYPVKRICKPVTVMPWGGKSFRNAYSGFEEARRISIHYGQRSFTANVSYLLKLAKFWVAHRFLGALRGSTGGGE